MTERLQHTFSAQAKQELVRIVLKDADCKRAELAAVVQACGSLVLSRGQMQLEIATEQAALARRMFGFIKEMTGQSVQILARQNQRLHKRNTYMLRLQGRDAVIPFLSRLGVWNGLGWSRMLPHNIQKTCCKRAYLRALFLACGSVSHPEKGYHMEWVFKEEELADTLAQLMETMDIHAHRMQRKTAWVVYLKDSEEIGTLLAMMGANRAILEHENERIMRQMKNNVQRAVNCDTANLQKTVEASVRQTNCIRFLIEKEILRNLPGPLRAAADARLEAPDASIVELAGMMSPPIGKSGMNHRLRKLVEIAEEHGYRG